MRRFRRLVFRSLFRVRVDDRRTDSLIGYVGDISEGGLRLISDAPLVIGVPLPLRLRMKDGESGVETAELDAVCVWRRQNPRTGHHEAGLKLERSTESYDTFVAALRRQRGVPATDVAPAKGRRSPAEDR